MPMTARETIRRLKRDGWVEEGQSGSHKIFIKDNRMIVVPAHKGDLKPGVEKDIKKKAGWKD